MTAKEIKARFFGQHVGCDVRVKNHPVFAHDDYVLHGVKDGFAIFSLFDADIDKCKLILRPLSSITDEEAVECFITGRPHLEWCEYKVVRNENGVGVLAWKDGVAKAGLSIKHKALDLAQSDFIRSLNFCLPFCGLDPIAEGWAVLEVSPSTQTPSNCTQVDVPDSEPDWDNMGRDYMDELRESDAPTPYDP